VRANDDLRRGGTEDVGKIGKGGGRKEGLGKSQFHDARGKGKSGKNVGANSWLHFPEATAGNQKSLSGPERK